MPTVTMKIDTSHTTAALQAAASAAQREAVKGVRKAAKEVALPIVQREVHGRLPGTTHAGATQNGAYVEQRHPGAAIDEFGGTRSDEILPTNARALSTPAGPRAAVRGKRTYRASHALQRAAQHAAPAMEEPIKKAVLDAYRPYFEIS
jgi:hypothetical protein